MRLIGLTGRSGSGKTEAGKCAEALGIPVLNCDRIYAEMACTSDDFLRELSDAFGKRSVVHHQLNRTYVRKIVFSDETKRKELNRLTAKYMTQEIRKRMSQLDPETPWVLLDAPTLFDCGMDSICDRIVCVIAPEENSLTHIMERDGITREQAEKRLSSQLSDDFFRNHADFVIENDRDYASLLKNATEIFQRILQDEIKE